MINLDNHVTQTSLSWFSNAVVSDMQRKRFLGGSYLTALDNWTQSNLGIDFVDVLSADVNLLRTIGRDLDQLQASGVDTRTVPVLLRLKAYYVCFSSKRSGVGTRPNKISAFDYLSKFKALTCPYCNLNVINNNQVLGRRTSQIDHFYSQRDYPLFSMSFFNLVPTCGDCNKTKMNSKILVNPHDNFDISTKSKFRISLASLPSGEIEFIIKGSFDREMNENEKVLGILGVYNMAGHQHKYQSLMERIEGHPRAYFDFTRQEFRTLMAGRMINIEKLFDFQSQRSNFFKSSLSKLKYDLLKKLYNLP